VGFDTSQPEALRLLHSWLACARHVECIAPAGSHRGNHRQDQAALSVLVLLSRERLGDRRGFACADWAKLPVGPSGAVGVRNDQLVQAPNESAQRDSARLKVLPRECGC
jgi:hypothetical protein